MKIRISSYNLDDGTRSISTIDASLRDWNLDGLRWWLEEHMVFERALLLVITMTVVDYWLRRLGWF